jgi:hypothetical protein
MATTDHRQTRSTADFGADPSVRDADSRDRQISDLTARLEEMTAHARELRAALKGLRGMASMEPGNCWCANIRGTHSRECKAARLALSRTPAASLAAATERAREEGKREGLEEVLAMLTPELEEARRNVSPDCARAYDRGFFDALECVDSDIRARLDAARQEERAE